MDVWPPGFSYPDSSALPLVFVPVPEPKAGKNRVHLDLATESAGTRRPRWSGCSPWARRRPTSASGDVPWTVLADPEGNEFCVLDPRPVYRDTGPVAAVVADCADPAAVAGFWALATGWKPASSTDSGVSLRSPDGLGPYLELLPSLDRKTVKNRIHLDVAPYQDDDHAAAVRALTERGRGAGRHRPGKRAVDRAGRPGGQRVLRAVAPLTSP